MDAIVVDTEKTGKDCIQYLREQVGRYRPTSISYFFFLAPLFDIFVVLGPSYWIDAGDNQFLSAAPGSQCEQYKCIWQCQ